MAGLRQIEQLVENAFISVLATNADIIAAGAPVRHWKDASNNKTYPVVVVDCADAPNEAWDADRSGDYFSCIVNIICQSYNADDTDKVDVYNLFGAVRDEIADSGLVASLSAVSARLTVYGVVVTDSSNDADIDNLNQCILTLDVHVGYVPST